MAEVEENAESGILVNLLNDKSKLTKYGGDIIASIIEYSELCDISICLKLSKDVNSPSGISRNLLWERIKT